MPIPNVPHPAPIATPEGDNEATPDAPLKPTPNVDLETPPGSAPDPYKSDKDPDPEQTKPTHKPEGLEKFIDEVVRGEYM